MDSFLAKMYFLTHLFFNNESDCDKFVRNFIFVLFLYMFIVSSV